MKITVISCNARSVLDLKRNVQKTKKINELLWFVVGCNFYPMSCAFSIKEPSFVQIWNTMKFTESKIQNVREPIFQIAISLVLLKMININVIEARRFMAEMLPIRRKHYLINQS